MIFVKRDSAASCLPDARPSSGVIHPESGGRSERLRTEVEISLRCDVFRLRVCIDQTGREHRPMPVRSLFDSSSEAVDFGEAEYVGNQENDEYDYDRANDVSTRGQ